MERTEEEFQEDALKEFKKLVKGQLGSISGPQIQSVERAISRLKRSDETWLEERAIWISRLELLLMREPGWEIGLQNLLLDRRKTLSPKYREIYDHNTAVIREAVASILSAANNKQTKRLRKKIARLKRELTMLIEQAKGD